MEDSNDTGDVFREGRPQLQLEKGTGFASLAEELGTWKEKRRRDSKPRHVLHAEILDI